MDFFMYEQKEEEKELPTFKEYAIDYKTCEPLYKNGDVVILERNEALKVWIYRVLKTQLNKYPSHSKNYGNALIEHLGTIYNETVKKVMIMEQIKECLLVNPYILSVSDFKFNYDDYNLKVDFKVETIYSTMEVNRFEI